MKLKNAFLILLSSLAFLGLQGCENDGPMENAGEEIDQGIDNANEGLDEVGDEIDNEF